MVLYGHKSSLESLISTHPSNESKVLVIYTGGTIGMKMNERGKLAPIPHTLERQIRKYPHMHDEEFAQNRFSNAAIAPVVLPDCREKTRVLYWVYEYKPLLDSSDMTMEDWIRIANDIRSVYDKFDGFVILHGTDTLAYTASALSFMMENLGKPVIITGSQIPLFETRSDGRDNFVGSVIIAGCYHIPEVTVFFNNKLYRGNRTVKSSAGSLAAFNSPNISPLVEFGVSIHVDHRLIFHPSTLAKFTINSHLCRNVGLLRIFPSISSEIIRSFLQPPLEGAVLQTYGAGNIPLNRKDILDVLHEATRRGMIIINITQCYHGTVDAIYETGQVLLDVNVLPGFDMTPEAALTKLSYVLANEKWDYEKKTEMMMKNLRGELTQFVEEDEEAGSVGIISSITSALQLSTKQDADQVKEVLLPPLFFTAISNSDLQRMEELFQHITDINMISPCGQTPLHIGADEGEVDVVRWLLQKGALVHARNRQGSTPLWIAVLNNHIKVMGLLMQTGAHLVLDDREVTNTLMCAADSADLPRLRSLHAAKVDLGQTDSTGRTALHVACSVGATDCVEFLLSVRVPISVVDNMDFTPKMCAQRYHFDDIVDLIEKYEQSS